MERWKSREVEKILDKVPKEFSSAVSEPAFDMDNISFCFWRTSDDTSWSSGFLEIGDSDGSEFLLKCLINSEPSAYQNFAEEYYEEDIPLSLIRHIYDHKPLTQEIINTLNPKVQLTKIQNELLEIGYLSGSV